MFPNLCVLSKLLSIIFVILTIFNGGPGPNGGCLADLIERSKAFVRFISWIEIKNYGRLIRSCYGTFLSPNVILAPATCLTPIGFGSETAEITPINSAGEKMLDKNLTLDLNNGFCGKQTLGTYLILLTLPSAAVESKKFPVLATSTSVWIKAAWTLHFALPVIWRLKIADMPKNSSFVKFLHGKECRKRQNLNDNTVMCMYGPDKFFPTSAFGAPLYQTNILTDGYTVHGVFIEAHGNWSVVATTKEFNNEISEYLTSSRRCLDRN